MFGWEFPPHISGGLGTACEGLTRGLAKADVDVTFVMPKAFGDEPAEWLQIIGANNVRWQEEVAVEQRSEIARELRVERSNLVETSSAGTLQPERNGDRDVARTPEQRGERIARAFRTIQVDSPLMPYQSDAGYAQRLKELRGEQTEAEPFVSGPTSSGSLDVIERPSAADDSPFSTFERSDWYELAIEIAECVMAGRRIEEHGFEFSGGYGPHLFDEVARLAVAAAEVARRERFDVVHAHDWMTYPAGVAAAHVAGVPLVCHLHASEYDRTGDSPDGRVLALEQLGLHAADMLVCVSHFTARVARERYRAEAQKIRVLHNAVTQKEQRSEWRVERDENDAPIVLFLGRVTFQKGPDYFLEAAEKVAALRPDVRFVVSGSGDMLPDIILRSARKELMDNVFFTGFLRGADVERMYSMADIYVMPSVSEPFGITPLEAMALDVPVILSRQSGVSEVVANALKVDFWDVDELANKILATLTYPALRNELVENGRDEVRRMRWELRGELMRDYYEEVLV